MLQLVFFYMKRTVIESDTIKNTFVLHINIFQMKWLCGKLAVFGFSTLGLGLSW